MARARARTSNRFWFALHSWFGLKLSLFMSFVLVTGTLAVFSSEMDWATHASMRIDSRPVAERASWGAMYAAARAAYPGWSIHNLTEPIDPWFAAQAFGRAPEGRTRLIDIDPYTARVRGDRHWLSFHRFFRNTHRHLMLPTRQAGDPLVFQGYTDSTWLVRPRVSYVAFDPASGEPVASHRSRDAGLHQRISEMADPLHFGYFGGLPTKIVWFVFGAAMSALSITGMVIYGKRTVRSLQRREAGAHSVRPRTGKGTGWVRQALDGMGRWKWAGVAAVIVVLALVPVTATQ